MHDKIFECISIEVVVNKKNIFLRVCIDLPLILLAWLMIFALILTLS
jgi:hypothetical protein